MNTNPLGCLFASALLAVSTWSATAQVQVTTTDVRANSTALTGRGGSLQGPVTEDVGPIGGTSGSIVAASDALAGPVPPATPPSPSLPGTTGVVTNFSRAGAVISDFGLNGKTMRCYASTVTDMAFLDGGTHQGYGGASFSVTFTIGSATPFALSGRFEPDDQDTLALVRIDGTGVLYFGPPGTYAYSGTLNPGTYTLRSGVTVYEVAGPASTFRESGLITANLVLGSTTPACAPDMGQQGGVPGADGILDNNDFIVFIDYFFALNPLADLGSQGGVSGPDGRFDNNDFIAFIDLFFNGC